MASKKQLNRHIRDVHGQPNKLECPLSGCSVLFSKNSNLRNHLKNIHKLDSMNIELNVKLAEPKKPKMIKKRFNCDMCGRFFSSKDNIREHAKTHQKNREKVNELNGWTQSQTIHYLLSINCVQLNLSQIGCSLCIKTFSKKSNLRTHLKNIHHIKPIENTISDNETARVAETKLPKHQKPKSEWMRMSSQYQKIVGVWCDIIV